MLLLDEVQHIADWGRRLKEQYDRLRRLRLPLHIAATGSSALRVGGASRESLARRFERLTFTHWAAAAVARHFGLSPAAAALLVVRLGSYPGSLPFQTDLARWSA